MSLVNLMTFLLRYRPKIDISQYGHVIGQIFMEKVYYICNYQYECLLRMDKQIPARYYAYASHAEVLQLNGEDFDVALLIEETTGMKKCSFWEYRWLSYLHEVAPKVYHELLLKTTKPMTLKRALKDKVKEAIK